MNEILLVDKEPGWTSFDVVAKIRSGFKAKETNNQILINNNSRPKIRVGHAGTLDPFATGLLIVLVGGATKNQDQFMKLDKEYEATLKLGFTSKTGDPEGEISPFIIPPKKKGSTEKIFSSVKPTRNEVQKVIKKFTGEVEQTPPAFSAIKINGNRAYKLAREGKNFEIPSRKITIHKLSIVDYRFPVLKIKVYCSSGTYIRALAEDIGRSLGCGAYLTELRRTKIGNFRVEDSSKVAKIISAL